MTDDWAKRDKAQVADLRELLQNSALSIILFTPGFGKNTKSLSELGMSVLLNKRILLMIKKGQTPGPMLLEIAAYVEYYDTKEEMLDAMTRTMEKMDEEETSQS